jgi:hypothetical protein
MTTSSTVLTTSYPAPEVDPVTSPAYLLALAARLFVVYCVWAFGAVALLVVVGIPGSYDALSGHVVLETSKYRPDTSLLTAWWLLTFVWSLVWALIFWLAKLSARLATFTYVVDTRAVIAERTFKAMYDTVQARRIPASGGVSVVPAGPGAPSHVQLVDGCYVGVITCYPYGGDLIVEATLSVSLRPLRWLAAAFGRTFRGGPPSAAAYDPARALLEVLHSVTRHGVALAAG